MAGTLFGCTVQIVSEKLKEDDIQVREKGYVDYQDMDFINLMVRYSSTFL